jgi:uncharacterized protein
MAGLPKVPRGSGEHPIALVAITSTKLEASKAFYAAQFGWEMMPLSSEACACSTQAGQAVALRAGNPKGFPAMVPFVAVDDVDKALARAVAAGCTVEKPKWKVPMVGDLARFTDPSGTIWGLTSSAEMKPREPLPQALGDGPKPPVGSICNVELYARDFAQCARFVREQYGWQTLESMPSYMMFDAGAGMGGVFQSHTPSLPAVAYVCVEDVKRKLAAIEQAGGKRMGDPMSMPGMGTFGYFNDPTGTAMGLIGP